jgi:hypothetical protein
MRLNDSYLFERFKKKFEYKYIVEPNSGCWLWIAGLFSSGYGMVSFPRVGTIQAHRISKFLYDKFPIETTRRGSNLVWDHLCKTRSCVNPKHLELVTPKENVHRAKHYHKKTCLNGHKLDGLNLGIYLRSSTQITIRYCRECVRKKDRERKRLLRARTFARAQEALYK